MFVILYDNILFRVMEGELKQQLDCDEIFYFMY